MTTRLLCGSAALLVCAGSALAGLPYRIDWYSVDQGGGVSGGGLYAVTGVAGQPDAGVSSVGAYALRGGFILSGPAAAATPDVPSGLALRLAIEPTAPHPLVPGGRVSFILPRTGEASLRLYDLRGGLLHTLWSGTSVLGRHELAWSGDDGHGHELPRGIYFLRLEQGGESRTRKLLLAR